jgi:hypothetical protein
MKGSFWNSDGFKDTAKHSFVHESIREHKLNFFAIIETGRANFSAPLLQHLSGGLNYVWYCLPPQGRSGGILVGFNSANIQKKM